MGRSAAVVSSGRKRKSVGTDAKPSKKRKQMSPAKKQKQAKPKPQTLKQTARGQSKTKPLSATKKTSSKVKPKKEAQNQKSSAKKEYTSKSVKKTKSNQVSGKDGVSIYEQEVREREGYTAHLPTRNKKGELVFEDCPRIRPNMTPKEVLQAGSFGGTYFRQIKSGVTGEKYSGVWKELPKDWLEGLNIGTQISSSKYNQDVNTYGVKCGGSLEMWESSGWIHKQDPYGWFQWYCRFYLGRRTDDDERQIGRWDRCAGVKGRWRNNLIAKCVRSGCAFDNMGVSPVVRQTLQHWGYKLNQDDFQKGAKRVK